MVIQFFFHLSLLAKKVNEDVEQLSFDIKTNDEIGALAHAFEERNKRLQSFLERERVFSTDVSHELRTPLTVILGAAEILSVNLSQEPKLLATANRIKRAALDTTDQVSALLMLSRSPEELSVSFINIRVIIQKEMEHCKPLLNDKPVSLQLEAKEDVSIVSHPSLVSIILRNLLRNACEHTSEGTISVFLVKDKIIIEDTGSGIVEENKAHLFQRGNIKSQSGYGFGLSIVRRISDYLKWSVDFDSMEDGGSRFTIFFCNSVVD
jgi:signal transduction histidine kinase